MTWQQILVIVLGLLLLVGGIPAVWRFAKGAARIILSVIIFLAVIALIWWAIVGLANLSLPGSKEASFRFFEKVSSNKIHRNRGALPS